MRIVILAIIIAISTTSCFRKKNKSDAYGNFEAKEYIISAETQGKLVMLNVEEGVSLKENQVVGVVDSVLLDLNREQLKAKQHSVSSQLDNLNAQIEVQEEQLKVLQKEKSRIEKLFNDGAATDQQMADINGKVQVLEKQIKSSHTQSKTILNEHNVISKQIDQISEQIKKCKVMNPVKGIVLEKFIEPYEVVVPGKAIYKISDIDEIYLRVYVSGSQLSKIKLGQQAEIYIDESEEKNKKLSGIVSWISAKAEFTPKIIQTKEDRVNLVYAVKISVKNDGSLKIGMPGEACF